MESFDLRLVSASALTPSVRSLRFERVGGDPIRFAPGQWVNLFLPLPGGESAEPLKRSYSIASAPDGSGAIELAITRVEGGAASTFLHALPIGGEIRAGGPHGMFVRAAEDAAPALFVATGTGLAPIRSMVVAALAAGSRAPMRVLLGVRREEDILWRAEMARWSEQNPAVRVDVTLSRPEEGWSGRRGWVQEHVPQLFAELDAASAHLWICGLERMVKSVREIGRGPLAIDRKRVHQEKYD